MGPVCVDPPGQLQDAQDALKSKEDQLMMVEQQLAQSSAEVSENGGGGNRRWRVASAQVSPATVDKYAHGRRAAT